MAALKAVALVAALAVAVPAQAEGVADWRLHTLDASHRFGLPVAWIERVMRVESGGRTMRGGRLTVSRAGAMGLMQLMPGTWRAMRAALGLGDDPFDPRDNILAGTAYLRAMYDRFGYPGMFAAYNAGPERYADYLAGTRSLPGETVAYLAAVAGVSAPAPRRAVIPRTEALFVQRDRVPDGALSSPNEASGAGLPSGETSRDDGLFAIRKP